MRIAMISTPLTHSGGGNRQVLRLAIELSKRGHEVEIFTNLLNQENCHPELLSRVKVNVVPVGFFLKIIVHILYRLGMGEYLCRLEILSISKAIKPYKFDIINCHNFSTNWAAYFGKRRLKIPVVWMCNEPAFWYFLPDQRKKRNFIIEFLFFNLFDKYTVRFIDHIVVLDKKNQDRVRKIYGRESTIIRSGIDTDFFEKGNGKKLRTDLGVENNIILLQVCSAVRYKLCFDSVLALSYLHEKYEQLKLIMVGYYIEEMLGPVVKRLGLNSKALIFSNVDDKMISDFYAACDIFLFPIDQTWGLAVVEAMAASKPVIVSEHAGVSEIIQNGVNGIVVKHEQAQEIAYHIEKLINNQKLREDIGQNAHEFVKNNLSWERYSEEMLKIFEEMLQK